MRFSSILITLHGKIFGGKLCQFSSEFIEGKKITLVENLYDFSKLHKLQRI